MNPRASKLSSILELNIYLKEWSDLMKQTGDGCFQNFIPKLWPKQLTVNEPEIHHSVCHLIQN